MILPNFFLFLWAIFALLDPDTDPLNLNPDPIRTGSETLDQSINSRNTVDPQYGFRGKLPGLVHCVLPPQLSLCSVTGFSLDADPALILMQTRIRLPKIMRIHGHYQSIRTIGTYKTSD